MTYAKPELVPMADARVAIQSGDGTSKHELPVESINGPLQVSTSAYEADE